MSMNLWLFLCVVGGCDSTLLAHSENRLLPMINPPQNYDYDLAVIGGGSGGLAAAKVLHAAPRIQCILKLNFYYSEQQKI